MGVVWSQSGHLPVVVQRRLGNGVRVLVVERPGTGFVHARLVVERPSTDPLQAPALAYELLGRCLASPFAVLDEVSEAPLAELLGQEDGLWATLRAPGPTSEVEAIQALHAGLQARLRDIAKRAMVNRQPLHREPPFFQFHGDYLALGAELPVANLRAWCERLTLRIKNPPLGAFPFERDLWCGDSSSPPRASMDWPEYYTHLLPAALGASPYGAMGVQHRNAVAALRWRQLRVLAQSVLLPDRLTLVLVGDVNLGTAETILGDTLGKLPERSTSRFPVAWEAAPDLGMVARRIQVLTSRASKVVVALQVHPGQTSDDRHMLVLAELISGVGSSVRGRLVGELGLADNVAVHVSVPGCREPHLFVVEATPAPGRTCGEVEAALMSSLMRMGREGVPEEDLWRAQRLVEVRETLVQDRAAELAEALGTALICKGDVARAFPMLAAARPLDRNAFQDTLRRILVRNNIVVLMLEADALVSPQDPQEARLIRLLTQVLARQFSDPSEVEGIVRETVLQLRMMPPTDRAKTLALLEAQL